MPIYPRSRIIRSLDSRKREDIVSQKALSILSAREEFSQKRHPLREKWVPLWPDHTSETVYRREAEMVVELILEAPQVNP